MNERWRIPGESLTATGLVTIEFDFCEQKYFQGWEI